MPGIANLYFIIGRAKVEDIKVRQHITLGTPTYSVLPSHLSTLDLHNLEMLTIHCTNHLPIQSMVIEKVVKENELFIGELSGSCV